MSPNCPNSPVFTTEKARRQAWEQENVCTGVWVHKSTYRYSGIKWQWYFFMKSRISLLNPEWNRLIIYFNWFYLFCYEGRYSSPLTGSRSTFPVGINYCVTEMESYSEFYTKMDSASHSGTSIQLMLLFLPNPVICISSSTARSWIEQPKQNELLWKKAASPSLEIHCTENKANKQKYQTNKIPVPWWQAMKYIRYLTAQPTLYLL